jgi:hypothetical protein
MTLCREIRIPASSVRSLVWQGDELVDWASGGQRFLLSGETVPRHVNYAFPFDAAVSSPSGEYAVIYARLGTKGLVLRRGEIVREINRSFYCADAYEYPVAILRLGDGREVLVHCPEGYCQIDFDELQTGKRLTSEPSRKPSDFFHARLIASPDGRTLASAGWIWHPVDAVRAFDVETALKDPSHLDGEGFGIDAWADETGAGFAPDGRLIVALNGIEKDGQDAIATADTPVEIRTFEFRSGIVPKVVHRSGRVGMLMAVGSRYVLGLHQCPKLIDATTGDVVQDWPHIRSGLQTSSILLDEERIPPPMALDPIGRRCAIADAEGITVLMFGDAE